MKELVRFINGDFEGNPLPTIMYKGRPCWIARQVGVVLEYGNGGKGFVDLISREWKYEFEVGRDFVILKGKELAELKRVFKEGGDYRHSCTESNSAYKYANSLMLLFESGVHLASIKTEKPIGKRLRRFIADEVMPQLARKGMYMPSGVDNEAKKEGISESLAGRRLLLDEAKESRLDRHMRSQALRFLVKVLKKIKHVAEDVVASYEIASVEEALGSDFSGLKPPMGDAWESQTEIAKRLGVTPMRVGLAITSLGLRGEIPDLAKCVLNKSKSSNKTVTSYVYSPVAAKRIEEKVKFMCRTGK